VLAVWSGTLTQPLAELGLGLEPVERVCHDRVIVSCLGPVIRQQFHVDEACGGCTCIIMLHRGGGVWVLLPGQQRAVWVEADIGDMIVLAPGTCHAGGAYDSGNHHAVFFTCKGTPDVTACGEEDRRAGAWRRWSEGRSGSSSRTKAAEAEGWGVGT
jgi:hypothetical protein